MVSGTVTSHRKHRCRRDFIVQYDRVASDGRALAYCASGLVFGRRHKTSALCTSHCQHIEVGSTS